MYPNPNMAPLINGIFSILISGLWDETDGFYYDHLRQNNHTSPMKILSMVGLVPLFSCMVLKDEIRRKFPDFLKRTNWFLENRKDLSKTVNNFISTVVNLLVDYLFYNEKVAL